MRKLIIDLDGVVFNTIRTIVDLYNQDHVMYKDFQLVKEEEIKSWEFNELSLESPECIDNYFNQPRFFENLVLMKSSEWIIHKLEDDYQIIFCSAGSYPNLQLKRMWLQKNFSKAEFIPVELPTYKDKSGVDMRGCILVDDHIDNLRSSNADIKICFGKEYEWNKDWKGIRCRDWEEVYSFLKEKKDGTN